MTIITGHHAIVAAERDGAIVLCKHTDPTESAREGLTLAEARAIAAEDPSLIWTEVDLLALAASLVLALSDEDAEAIRTGGSAAWRADLAPAVAAEIDRLVRDKRVGAWVRAAEGPRGSHTHRAVGSMLPAAPLRLRVVIDGAKPRAVPWEEEAIEYDAELDEYRRVTRGGHGRIDRFVGHSFFARVAGADLARATGAA